MVIINAIRDTYSAEESALQSMTVKELINCLEQFDEDDKVVLSHDNGYTYGYLGYRRIDEE